MPALFFPFLSVPQGSASLLVCIEPPRCLQKPCLFIHCYSLNPSASLLVSILARLDFKAKVTGFEYLQLSNVCRCSCELFGSWDFFVWFHLLTAELGRLTAVCLEQQSEGKQTERWKEIPARSLFVEGAHIVPFVYLWWFSQGRVAVCMKRVLQQDTI